MAFQGKLSPWQIDNSNLHIDVKTLFCLSVIFLSFKHFILKYMHFQFIWFASAVISYSFSHVQVIVTHKYFFTVESSVLFKMLSTCCFQHGDMRRCWNCFPVLCFSSVVVMDVANLGAGWLNKDGAGMGQWSEIGSHSVLLTVYRHLFILLWNCKITLILNFFSLCFFNNIHPIEYLINLITVVPNRC